ncbi:MAG: uroporphyrinogen-III decarboxylase-like protein [Verrucomicrobia bacterium]|nr:uroporphyrinogen-III decarboxylase-like protein [Verrucomicrobiota bacterium]
MMTSRERVLTAARRGKADRIPLDIWYTGEVRDRLLAHFGVATEKELWARLHVDRIVAASPRYIGPPERVLADGTKIVPPWWNRAREISYGTGVYTEIIDWPLKNATTIEELERFQWPSADWYDFSDIAAQCDAWPENAIHGWYVAPFFWHNYVRGLEQSCVDLIAEPEMTGYILGRITAFCWEFACRFFEAGCGKIHIVQVTDDYGSQRDLLIREESYVKWFKPIQKKFIDLARQAGVLVMHHDDGAIRRIIPHLIELGVDILNPIQHVCPGMEMDGLKRDFGKQICFHGGVDNQQVLARGSVEDVRREVRDCMRILGAGGGYILAPCHNIQPVTPVENVIAMYEMAWEEGRY